MGGFSTAGYPPDNVTLDINASGQMQEKSGGTGSTQIANGAVTATKLSSDQVIATQTGHSGEYMTTNGSATSWAAITGTLPSQSGKAGMSLFSDGSNASWLPGTPVYIETLTFTASSATQTTAGTYTAYRFILCRWRAQKSGSTGHDPLYVRFNGNSGANYYDWGIGNTTITNGTGQTQARIGSTVDGTSESSGWFCQARTTYASGNIMMGTAQSGVAQANASSWIAMAIGFGVAATSSITSVSIVPGGAPDAINGTFDFFGIL